MDDDRLRAWWFHRQGLAGAWEGESPAAVLARSGWARSVGGAGPYLTLQTRCGARRGAVDEAVAQLEIHELPSARGCTYVVPAVDFALALQLSQSFGPEADMKVARKLGVTDREVDKLSAAALIALRRGPLAPDELREATGGASRSLGEEGKKKGLSTTLPLALGRLQSMGEIRRVPINGRLDQQRYRYTLWSPNPIHGATLAADEARVELARRFFSWAGPATFAEFRDFAALGVKAARAALEALDLEALGDEAGEDRRFLLSSDREAYEAFRTPKQRRYALVSSADGHLLNRCNLGCLLAAEDAARTAAADKGQVEIAGVAVLPNHAILDRGRIVGLWEYDPESAEIVWRSFRKPDAALRAAVRATEDFVRTDLGDMRAFSLDSPKSRVPRLELLRAAAA